MNPHPTDTDSLSAYAERMERELKQREQGTAKVVSDPDDYKSHGELVNERDAALARAEAAERACAEMRYMLNAASLRTDIDWPDNYEFGRDYVHKDDVKPLINACHRALADFSALSARGDFADDDLPHVKATMSVLNAALAHAREKGLL